MGYMAGKTAADIIKRGTQDKECVVCVSGEQMGEEVEKCFMSVRD